MDVCYVDESGSAELLCTAAAASTPVFVISGLIVPGPDVMGLIRDYVRLKNDYNPSLATQKLSAVIATEVKGSNLRADMRAGSRRRYRSAIGYVDNVIKLIEKHNCRLVARIVVKEVDVLVDDRAFYSSAIQWMCRVFQSYLAERSTEGLIILDSRTKVKNTPLTNAITTQKLRQGGDPFPNLCEVPVFGHSDSHVALQMADIVASAVLFPAASAAYCGHLTWNKHAHPAYENVRRRYAQRLRALQYRHDAGSGRWEGGIWVTGSRGSMTSALFSPITVTSASGVIAASATTSGSLLG